MSNATISLSPSSISDLSCPFKFEMLRVQRKWPPSATSPLCARGTAFHEIMAELYSPAFGIATPHETRLDGAVAKAIQGLHLQDPFQRNSEGNELRELAETYMRSDLGKFKALGVEMEDRFPLSCNGKIVASLQGRLDRLQVYDDELDTLVVVDLSLSPKRPSDESIWLSLVLGRHLFPGFRKHRFEIHVVRRTGVSIDTYTGDAFKGTHKVVADAAAEFASFSRDGIYPARMGEACRFCKCAEKCPLQTPVDIRDLSLCESG